MIEESDGKTPDYILFDICRLRGIKEKDTSVR